MVTDKIAKVLWPEDGGGAAEVVIRVDAGAAHSVGSAVGVAMNPVEPRAVSAAVPPNPRLLRQRVESDVTGLFLGLGLVGIVAGALSIANTAVISVIQRSTELALRRALGASPLHVASQILAEAGILARPFQ